MTRSRSWALAAVLVCAALTLAACGSSHSSSSASSASTGSSGSTKGLHTVNVAYVPLPLFEPLYVAMHDGDFAKHGIAVHLTNISSGQSAISLAATNKVQAVLGGFSAGMFNAIHQGLSFKVVGSMAQEASGTAANGLVVASKAGISSAAQLKGKSIAVDGGAGSTGSYLLAAALQGSGVSLSDVHLVNLQFPEMESALKGGSVQAAYMSTPFLGAALSDGTGKLLKGAPVGVAVTGLIYGGQFATSAQAQPFFDALADAARTLQGTAANSPANLAIVAAATGESLKDLEAEPPSRFSPTLVPPTATLSAMQSVFAASKTLDYSGTLPSSKYVDSSFSSAAGS